MVPFALNPFIIDNNPFLPDARVSPCLRVAVVLKLTIPTLFNPVGLFAVKKILFIKSVAASFA